MSIVAVIPVRMASQRFPGKPLKLIRGLPMVEHVWQRLKLCKIVDDIIVATCDDEIADVVKSFGGKVVMTSSQHESCLDRVAEAVENLNAEIVVNVQGDAPLIYPDSIKDLVAPLLQEKGVLFTDMMGLIEEDLEAENVNVVKVVFDNEKNALYYSREPVPSVKKTTNNLLIQRYKQFGINAFRQKSLFSFTSLDRTFLEKIESVDMLRLLESGYKIRMVLSSHQFRGVDTREDLDEVERIMQNDPIISQYITRAEKTK